VIHDSPKTWIVLKAQRIERKSSTAKGRLTLEALILNGRVQKPVRPTKTVSPSQRKGGPKEQKGQIKSLRRSNWIRIYANMTWTILVFPISHTLCMWRYFLNNKNRLFTMKLEFLHAITYTSERTTKARCAYLPTTSYTFEILSMRWLFYLKVKGNIYTRTWTNHHC